MYSHRLDVYFSLILISLFDDGSISRACQILFVGFPKTFDSWDKTYDENLKILDLLTEYFVGNPDALLFTRYFQNSLDVSCVTDTFQEAFI